MNTDATPLVWLTLTETAYRLRMSKSAFFALMKRDKDFPPRYRFGGKGICIRLADVEAYESKRAVVATGQATDVKGN